MLPRRTKVAYRLSTNGQRACNACKGHAAHRFFRTRAVADANRAHKGCNCAIVPHPLPMGTWNQYFTPDRDVWDDRWHSSRRSRGRGR